MSLDITILGKDGTPAAEVSIDVKRHADLMEYVGPDCPLLMRMRDYYGDTDYSAEEVLQLLTEFFRLKEAVLGHVQLSRLLTELVRLAEAAIERETGLAVIAD